MLVRIAVCLEVHGELQVLKVLIVTRVFLQKYVDFLELKCVLMIGVDYLTTHWCCWKFLGCRSRWGLLCWLLISNFEIFEIIFLMKEIYVAHNILL